MPKGIPLTQEAMEKRRSEIASAAANIFLEKGFAETSMREIATSTGTGKSTLYDYFPTKDDIFIYIIAESVQDLIRRAGPIISREKPVPERLYELMHMHLAFLLEKKAFFLKLSLESQRLKPGSQSRIQVQRYIYQDLLQGLIEEGIAEGSLRSVNPTMAMKALMAMMTPVVFTSRPYGAPEDMLDDALDLFFEGVCISD